MNEKKTAVLYAVLAAVLYAINVPLAKGILSHVTPTVMASLLYLGAGVGLLLCTLIGKAMGKETIREPLTKKELPYTVAMVVLDIAAPIFLMLGIRTASAANVSLLNNFEIVATSLIAYFVFREALSRRLCIAILLVTAASAVLTFEGAGSLSFNIGSLFVLAACTCWGFENNCTRMISSKSSVEIVIIKGCGSGLGSLVIAYLVGERLPAALWALCVLLLGFVSYGISIHFYILAQKELGAAKTSAFYSITPFLGATFGTVLFWKLPGVQFFLALPLMILATVLIVRDTLTSRQK